MKNIWWLVLVICAACIGTVLLLFPGKPDAGEYAKLFDPEKIKEPDRNFLDSENNPGYVKGKVVILSRSEERPYLFELAPANKDLPDEIRANSPDEVGTVVWVCTQNIEQGKGLFASRQNVDVIDISIPAVVGRVDFENAPTSNSGAYADAPWEDTVDWISGLQRLNDAKSIIQAFVHRSPSIRNVAKKEVAEGRFPDPTPEEIKSAIPKLVQKSLDKDPLVRNNAMSMLNKIDSAWASTDTAKSQIVFLLDGLVKPDPEIRSSASKMLEDIDKEWHSTPEAKKHVPTLVKSASNQDKQVRETALKTLDRIDANWSSSKAAGAIKQELIAKLRYREPEVRESSRKLLDRIDADWLQSPEAKQAVPAFVVTTRAILGYPTPAQKKMIHAQRMEVIETLGKMGPAAKAAVPGLTKLFKDKDPEIVAAAKKAVELIESGTD